MGAQPRVWQLVLLAAISIKCIQAANAHRSLRQATVAVTPANWQHVQSTMAIGGKTCSELPSAGDQLFADRFRGAMRQDVISYLRSMEQEAALETLRAAGDVCFNGTFEGAPYAAVRAHVWFRGVSSASYRDTLFNATREAMCKGGFKKQIYGNIATLMETTGSTVIHNNGSRCPRTNPTPNCPVGWVPYADPNNPACSKASPSPAVSPSPSLSPSPVASPSPSPSPNVNVTSPSPSPNVNTTSPSPSPDVNATSPSPSPSVNETSPSPSPSPSINGTSPSPSPSPSINATSPSPSPSVNETSPSPSPSPSVNATSPSPSPSPDVNGTSPSPSLSPSPSPSPAVNVTSPSPSPSPSVNVTSPSPNP